VWKPQRTGSVLCPSCGSLVGVADERCLTCGRVRPGLWGLTAVFRSLGRDMGFVPIVMWSCGAAYLATLAADPGAIGGRAGLSLLSPTLRSLVLFGASGAVPVLGLGHWWTVLSAAWLHAGLLHILFNMMFVRELGPLTVHLYGVARTILIYTVSAAVGFLASSVVGAYLGFLPMLLRGSDITVGASGALFGLLAAIFHYGRRGGSRMMSDRARAWAIGGLILGFVMPNVDNWSHIGGFLGGYLASRFLDPLSPERGDHVLLALLCLVLSFASVIASVVIGLGPVRPSP
jgi:membrane associated rhomboid family serine protease